MLSGLLGFQRAQSCGQRHYLIRAIPYQDPEMEAERLRAVHEARVKMSRGSEPLCAHRQLLARPRKRLDLVRAGQDLPIGIQQIELHSDELADIVFGLILDQ